MKDYGKMSDFEINKAVAACVGVEVQEWNGKIFGGVERKIDNVTSVAGVIDYCNNPSDAWPIMKESLIGVTPDEDGVTMHFYGDWTARAHCKNLQFTDKNPLRAAMIVYLMMKDVEK